MSKIKTRPFDVANYLNDEEDITEYMRQVLEDGDPAELGAALGAIARVRGMTDLARDTGLSREACTKASRANVLPALIRCSRCLRRWVSS